MYSTIESSSNTLNHSGIPQTIRLYMPFLRARNATKLVFRGLPPGRLNHAGVTANTTGESPGEVAVAATAAGTADGTGAKALEVVPEAAALSGDVIDAAGGDGPAVL